MISHEQAEEIIRQQALLIDQQRMILALLERLDQTTMTTQDDVVALTAEVQNIDSAATTGFQAITTEVQSLESQLQAAGATVDLSALKAAIDKTQTDIGAGVSSVSALVPGAAAQGSTDGTDGSSSDTSGDTSGDSSSSDASSSSDGSGTPSN